MRTPLIVANWKMNSTVADGLKFLTYLERQLPIFNPVDVVVCPPYTALYSLSVFISERGKIKLGAQNCHQETSGAFTGEVSPAFLKELNCQYVILGHSERRTLFGETDEVIAKKVEAVLVNEMIPLLCVGETEHERDVGKTLKVITKQLANGLTNVSLENLSRVVIAYEPVWAIGTGKTATVLQAEEVHETIRNWLKKKAGDTTADKIRILYGGSVNPTNIDELMKQPNIDGVLVGSASLSVDTFIQIVNYQGG